MLLLSHFSHVLLCATPFLGFSRQEHWSGLLFPSPMHKSEKWQWSRSVISDSSWPHGLQPTRLLHPWDFPGNSTGVGCHCLLRNLDNSILKRRDVTLLTKVRTVKAMLFPVVMYRWTIKKAECQGIYAFELWCWRRLLQVLPWTARRSNQSILKEINTEHWLEGLVLMLKLQYFGYVMQRADSLEKTLMLGKTEGNRRRGRQRMRWLDGIIDSMDMSLSKLQ